MGSPRHGSQAAMTVIFHSKVERTEPQLAPRRHRNFIIRHVPHRPMDRLDRIFQEAQNRAASEDGGPKRGWRPRWPGTGRTTRRNARRCPSPIASSPTTSGAITSRASGCLRPIATTPAAPCGT